jgi:hypothetical protein
MQVRVLHATDEMHSSRLLSALTVVAAAERTPADPLLSMAELQRGHSKGGAARVRDALEAALLRGGLPPEGARAVALRFGSLERLQAAYGSCVDDVHRTALVAPLIQRLEEAQHQVRGP